jgi:hypothetical protein
MLLWISTGILDIRRHLESDKKLFFDEICPTKIQAQIIRQNAKKKQNTLSYGRKTFFFVIPKTLPLIFIQNMAKKYLKIGFLR